MAKNNRGEMRWTKKRARMSNRIKLFREKSEGVRYEHVSEEGTVRGSE